MHSLVEKTDTLAVLAVTGRLDSTTAPVLQAELEQLVQSGCRYLILDFTAVTLLASSGLRLLIVVDSKCRRVEGALVLVAVPEPVGVVLQLSGFAPHFRRYPDVTSARAELSA